MKTSLRVVVAAVLLLALNSCRSSKIIAITIRNTGSQPLHNIEIRYPKASFGVGDLAPGATFSYKFQPTGEGKLALSFEEAGGKQHHEEGPEVHEADDGSIALSIDGDGNNTWENKLRTRQQRD